jgi:hypothetical protein
MSYRVKLHGDHNWGRIGDAVYWDALKTLKFALAALQQAMLDMHPQIWLKRAQKHLDKYMNTVGGEINVNDYGGAAHKYMWMAESSLKEGSPADVVRNSIQAALENLRGQIELHEKGGDGVPLDYESIR